MTLQNLIDFANTNHIPWSTKLAVGGADVAAIFFFEKDGYLVLDDSIDVVVTLPASQDDLETDQ